MPYLPDQPFGFTTPPANHGPPVPVVDDTPPELTKLDMLATAAVETLTGMSATPTPNGTPPVPEQNDALTASRSNGRMRNRDRVDSTHTFESDADTTSESGAESINPRKAQLMTVPPELRLLIYEYLTKTVYLTRGMDLKELHDGSSLLTITHDTGDPGAVLRDTIIPGLLLVCKQIRQEYETFIRGRDQMDVVLTDSVADLRRFQRSLRSASLQHRALRVTPFTFVRRCCVGVQWQAVWGRGTDWHHRSAAWLWSTPLAMLSARPRSPFWTPTKQVARDTVAFVHALRAVLSPQCIFWLVVTTSRLETVEWCPMNRRSLVTDEDLWKRGYWFSAADFMDTLEECLLGTGDVLAPPSTRRTSIANRLTVSFHKALPLCCTMARNTDLIRQERENITPGTLPQVAPEFDESNMMTWWAMRMAKGPDGKWTEGEWRYELSCDFE